MDYLSLNIDPKEYFASSAERIQSLQLTHLKVNEKWSQIKLYEFNAKWMVVLGNSGKIASCDDNPNTIPTPEELARIARKTKDIPFVFSETSLVEDKSNTLENRISY